MDLEPRLAPARWSAVVVLGLLLVSAACATPRVRPAATDTASQHVDLGEISFDLAGGGWRERPLSRGAQFVRSYGERRVHSVGVWSVDVPEALRGLTPEQHAALYFREEERTPRTPPWTNFVVGGRDIDGVRYPSMTFAVPNTADARRREGMLLLYFPQDFAARQRFFVIMWFDVHPASSASGPRDVLDHLVRTLAVHRVEEEV